MAKKGFTAADLSKLGYIETEKGVFSPPNSGAKKVISEDLIQKPIVDTPAFKNVPCTEWFIPYQCPSKKNSRINFVKNGKQISIPSQRHKDYITATKMYWQVFGKEFRQSIAELGLEWPVNVEMTFVRSTKQIVDYFGPGETVFDCMTDFGWWPDDNSRYGKPFFGDMEVDKNNPGTRIKLLLP